MIPLLTDDARVSRAGGSARGTGSWLRRGVCLLVSYGAWGCRNTVVVLIIIVSKDVSKQRIDHEGADSYEVVPLGDPGLPGLERAERLFCSSTGAVRVHAGWDRAHGAI